MTAFAEIETAPQLGYENQETQRLRERPIIDGRHSPTLLGSKVGAPRQSLLLKGVRRSGKLARQTIHGRNFLSGL